jgi:dihydrodipicolinate synthase/N-acetylneuraminate lyase
MKLNGCLPVLAIPFLPDERIDTSGLAKVVEVNIASGVNAVTCFGLAGELFKLDDADRSLVLETVMDTVQDRVPVIVGCEHSGSLAAARRCRQAAGMGAAAVMLLPPSFTVPQRSSIRDYFLRCAEAANIPVIVQDAPAWTGIQLPVDLLLEMNAENPLISAVKLEDPPISEKAVSLRNAGIAVISGYGAVHFGEDYMLGSIDAFMPGCAFPEVMVHAWRLAVTRDTLALKEFYARMLPLLVAELTDLDTFIEVQKRALVKRGLFTSATMREPHRSIPKSRIAYIDELIDEVLKMGMELNNHVRV